MTYVEGMSVLLSMHPFDKHEQILKEKINLKKACMTVCCVECRRAREYNNGKKVDATFNVYCSPKDEDNSITYTRSKTT